MGDVISGPAFLTMVDRVLLEDFIRENPPPAPEQTSRPQPAPTCSPQLTSVIEERARSTHEPSTPRSVVSMATTRRSTQRARSAPGSIFLVIWHSESCVRNSIPGANQQWTEQGIEHKVDDAYTKETRRGWLLEGAGRGQGPRNNGPVSSNNDPSEASPSVQITSNGEKTKLKPPPSHAEILMGIGSSAELFHSQDDRCFAQINVDGHRENHEIKSTTFRRWLTRGFYEKTGKPPTAESLQSVIALLEAQAMFDWPGGIGLRPGCSRPGWIDLDRSRHASMERGQDHIRWLGDRGGPAGPVHQAQGGRPCRFLSGEDRSKISGTSSTSMVTIGCCSSAG